MDFFRFLNHEERTSDVCPYSVNEQRSLSRLQTSCRSVSPRLTLSRKTLRLLSHWALSAEMQLPWKEQKEVREGRQQGSRTDLTRWVGPEVLQFRPPSGIAQECNWWLSWKCVSSIHSQSPKISYLMFITGYEYVCTQLLQSSKQTHCSRRSHCNYSMFLNIFQILNSCGFDAQVLSKTENVHQPWAS